MRLLADQAIDDLFSGISPPPAMNVGGSDPVQGLGKFIGFAIQMFILLAGMFLLLYLLWELLIGLHRVGKKKRLLKLKVRSLMP